MANNAPDNPFIWLGYQCCEKKLFCQLSIILSTEKPSQSLKDAASGMKFASEISCVLPGCDVFSEIKTSESSKQDNYFCVEIFFTVQNRSSGDGFSANDLDVLMNALRDSAADIANRLDASCVSLRRDDGYEETYRLP